MRSYRSRAPQPTGETGGKRAYAEQKNAGQVTISAVNVRPGFAQARWNFHLVWRKFHLAWRKFHLVWRNFYLAGGFFSLCGGIFALPGGMFACLAEFCPVWWVFRLVWWGFLLFTWPGGLLIELIALHPAWHWRISALHATRPSLNTQTAEYYLYFYPRWRNFRRIWGRIFSRSGEIFSGFGAEFFS